MQDIYKEIEQIEAEYAKGNIDPQSTYHYHSLVFYIRQPKRFFDTMIKYKFYEHKVIKKNFFNACCIYGQKAIYDKYMPNYFLKAIRTLIYLNAPYEQWHGYLNYWHNLNRSAQTKRKFHTLGFRFVATIFTLHLDDSKKDLLNDILQHPIYKKMIPIYNDFLKTIDMQYIDALEELCLNHIINLRQTNNFNDPWCNFYSDFLNSDEYQNFMQPYYEYMDRNSISYQDKLIFFLSRGSISSMNKNIGDVFVFTQSIINWSLQHKVRLIALLTPFQQEWLGVYFKDYFSHIITLDPDDDLVPVQMTLLYPAPNRAIAIDLDTTDNIPYYFPRTVKRHYNHYTSTELHKASADIGKPVMICQISDEVKADNQKLFKVSQSNPNKIILIAPNSMAMDGFTKSNTTLKEFWVTLVNKLKKDGYVPIINLSKTDEQHYFDDCLSIYLPLSHIVDFVNNIAGFIGARSGLCDLLCASNDNVKKYNITPIEFIDWGNDLAPHFHEVRFKFDSMLQHIDDIINSLNGKSVKAFENQQCHSYLIFPDFS